MQQFPDKIQGIFWFLISRVGMVALIISARYLAESVSPMEITTLQNVFALLFFIPIFRKRGFKNVVYTKRIYLHTFRGFIAVAGIVIWYYAFTKIPLPEAVAINYSLPLITTILAIIILKEKVFGNTWITLLIGFIGVLIIVRPGFESFNHIHLLIILATSCWALSDILNKKLLATDSSETIVFYMSLTAIIFTLPCTIRNFQLINFPQIVLFTFMGIMSNLAYITTAIAYSKNTTIAYLQPFDFVRLVLVIIFSYLIFGEVIDFMSVMGVIVILASNHMLFAMKQTEMEIVLSKQKIEELMLKQKQFFMFVIMQLEKLTSHLDQCVESLKVCKNNPKNIEELTGIVEQLNDETIDLINRVNDLNKIETDTLRVKITKFNLHKLIETIQKELLLKSEDLGVEIKVDILKNIEIETDREILRRIIRGILINSLDIRNLCENISIFIERRNEKNVLIIQDNGIEPEELKEISENEKIKNYEIMKFNYRISKKLAQKLGMSMVFKRQKNLNITEITLP